MRWFVINICIEEEIIKIESKKMQHNIINLKGLKKFELNKKY